MNLEQIKLIVNNDTIEDKVKELLILSIISDQELVYKIIDDAVPKHIKEAITPKVKQEKKFWGIGLDKIKK